MRENWKCDGYRKQHYGEVQLGLRVPHDGELTKGMWPSDVRWLMLCPGRLRDAQILSVLQSSGASLHEQDCFPRAVRARFSQLRKVADLVDRAAGL